MSIMTVDTLAQLPEFVPYAQKHPRSRKGYVVGMRRKNARDELDERDVYLSRSQVVDLFEGHSTAGKNPSAKMVAALRTVEAQGYTYHGATMWKPPLGKAPVFIDDSDRALSEQLDFAALRIRHEDPQAADLCRQAALRLRLGTCSPKPPAIKVGVDVIADSVTVVVRDGGTLIHCGIYPLPRTKPAGGVPLSDNPQPLPANPYLSDKGAVQELSSEDVQTVIEWVFREIGKVGNAHLLSDAVVCAVRRLESQLRDIPQQPTAEGGACSRRCSETSECDGTCAPASANQQMTTQGDKKILWGVVANAGRLSKDRKSRWSHVSDATGQGSTYSVNLCSRFGCNPHEEVGGSPDA